MFCREIFRTKWFFFLKNKWVWHFFWFWMTKFQIFGRSFRQWCQKQSPRDQRKVCWNVLWKKAQLYIFWWFFWGNSDLQETPVSSVRHSTRPVEHSKGQISGRNETFPTFGHWARIFWISGRRILADLPKLLSMWPEQLLEQIDFFFKKMRFYYISPLLAKNFQILRIKIRQRFQVRKLPVRKNFKRKTGRTRKAF